MDLKAAFQAAKANRAHAAEVLASLAAYGIPVARDHELAIAYREASEVAHQALMAWSREHTGNVAQIHAALTA